jgi:hypothetical protein
MDWLTFTNGYFEALIHDPTDPTGIQSICLDIFVLEKMVRVNDRRYKIFDDLDAMNMDGEYIKYKINGRRVIIYSQDLVDWHLRTIR